MGQCVGMAIPYFQTFGYLRLPKLARCSCGSEDNKHNSSPVRTAPDAAWRIRDRLQGIPQSLPVDRPSSSARTSRCMNRSSPETLQPRAFGERLSASQVFDEGRVDGESCQFTREGACPLCERNENLHARPHGGFARAIRPGIKAM